MASSLTYYSPHASFHFISTSVFAFSLPSSKACLPILYPYKVLQILFESSEGKHKESKDAVSIEGRALC